MPNDNDEPVWLTGLFQNLAGATRSKTVLRQKLRISLDEAVPQYGAALSFELAAALVERAVRDPVKAAQLLEKVQSPDDAELVIVTLREVADIEEYYTTIFDDAKAAMTKRKLQDTMADQGAPAAPAAPAQQVLSLDFSGYADAAARAEADGDRKTAKNSLGFFIPISRPASEWHWHVPDILKRAEDAPRTIHNDWWAMMRHELPANTSYDELRVNRLSESFAALLAMTTSQTQFNEHMFLLAQHLLEECGMLKLLLNGESGSLPTFMEKLAAQRAKRKCDIPGLLMATRAKKTAEVKETPASAQQPDESRKRPREAAAAPQVHLHVEQPRRGTSFRGRGSGFRGGFQQPGQAQHFRGRGGARGSQSRPWWVR